MQTIHQNLQSLTKFQDIITVQIVFSYGNKITKLINIFLHKKLVKRSHTVFGKNLN